MEKTDLRVKRMFVVMIIIIGSFVIFYLSWLPKPNIGLLPYFPKWLGKWIDAYGNLRTAVPFFLMGILLEALNLNSKTASFNRAVIISCLFLIVLVAEIGQIRLPNRHFDFLDILFGTLGSISGIFLTVSLKIQFYRILKNR